MRTVGNTNEFDPLREKHIEVGYPVVRICTGCKNACALILPAQILFKDICGADGAEEFVAANYGGRRVVIPESSITDSITAKKVQIDKIVTDTVALTNECARSDIGGMTDIYQDGVKVGYQCGATGEEFINDLEGES